ncbi:LysE/ArgO family amino acid transporter [Desulfosediminicola ganghwensis]|uniref:LysE/ArgO family amino acid transporter n=1 Tax=Desulfosediminicola ganghwensis TaxID=2569540 RepID=UPI0010AD8A09|nr:LysE/ArgO family amino acid transporter [Desulfosediminicola ganghwensis]
MNVFLQGMATGAGLIIAIGAQNAFVLTQGVRKQHNWAVATICSFCDAFFIFLGAAGVGTLVVQNPVIRNVAGCGGALFLVYYGYCSLRSAIAGNRLEKANDIYSSRWAVILATFSVTLLNPHMYLDTVVLLGGISGQFGAEGRYVFAAGACLASFIWFYTLSLGGVLLSPILNGKTAWRILDGLICITMWTIAFHLVPIRSLTAG